MEGQDRVLRKQGWEQTLSQETKAELRALKFGSWEMRSAQPQGRETIRNGERCKSYSTGPACSEARENRGRVRGTPEPGQAGLSSVLVVLFGSRHYSHRLLRSVRKSGLCVGPGEGDAGDYLTLGCGSL